MQAPLNAWRSCALFIYVIYTYRNACTLCVCVYMCLHCDDKCLKIAPNVEQKNAQTSRRILKIIHLSARFRGDICASHIMLNRRVHMHSRSNCASQTRKIPKPVVAGVPDKRTDKRQKCRNNIDVSRASAGVYCYTFIALNCQTCTYTQTEMCVCNTQSVGRVVIKLSAMQHPHVTRFG